MNKKELINLLKEIEDDANITISVSISGYPDLRIFVNNVDHIQKNFDKDYSIIAYGETNCNIFTKESDII